VAEELVTRLLYWFTPRAMKTIFCPEPCRVTAMSEPLIPASVGAGAMYALSVLEARRVAERRCLSAVPPDARYMAAVYDTIETFPDGTIRVIVTAAWRPSNGA
jgi:hypothetical protein